MRNTSSLIAFYILILSCLVKKTHSWIPQSNHRIKYASTLTINKPTSAVSSTSSSQTQSLLVEDNTNEIEVSKVEKFARLPVWPAWNGVLIFLLSKILPNDVIAKLEDTIGGRVCPQFFFNDESSPFLMLVHHVHSFSSLDILRFIQRTFFPEGFPSHPHRGFITLTILLDGGFVHRDSNGVKQLYGSGDKYEGRHSQWMVAGSGILHEEMWDIPSFSLWNKQELYQLWINLPSRYKLTKPQCILLGGDDTPTIITNSANTMVLCGEYNGCKASIQPYSSMNIFHVKLIDNTQWSYTIPNNHQTIIIYVRRGSISIDNTIISTHHTAFLASSSGSTHLTITNAYNNHQADFLLLSGEQLNEPIAAKGSMVMNSDFEIQQAYNDYSLGRMGAPWDHTLSDDDWLDHIRRFPSSY